MAKIRSFLAKTKKKNRHVRPQIAMWKYWKIYHACISAGRNFRYWRTSAIITVPFFCQFIKPLFRTGPSGLGRNIWPSAGAFVLLFGLSIQIRVLRGDLLSGLIKRHYNNVDARLLLHFNCYCHTVRKYLHTGNRIRKNFTILIYIPNSLIEKKRKKGLTVLNVGLLWISLLS